jgi:hypothetical protein
MRHRVMAGDYRSAQAGAQEAHENGLPINDVATIASDINKILVYLSSKELVQRGYHGKSWHESAPDRP